MVTCPKCSAQHNRGAVNGVDGYRCLSCGHSWTGEPVASRATSSTTDVTLRTFILVHPAGNAPSSTRALAAEIQRLGFVFEYVNLEPGDRMVKLSDAKEITREIAKEVATADIPVAAAARTWRERKYPQRRSWQADPYDSDLVSSIDSAKPKEQPAPRPFEFVMGPTKLDYKFGPSILPEVTKLMHAERQMLESAVLLLMSFGYQPTEMLRVFRHTENGHVETLMLKVGTDEPTPVFEVRMVSSFPDLKITVTPTVLPGWPKELRRG
jgi:hypothetical protein